MVMKAIWKLLRPHQWLKNAFVLAGFIFAHRWTEADLLLHAALAFAAFCAMASAVYVGNDLMDLQSDRHHPTKKNRPIANGSVPAPVAGILAAVLALLGTSLAWTAAPTACAFVVGYAALNVAYSLRLKHVVIIDVFCISAGFMLRLLAGTVGLGIAPSSWLLLCGMMITLFLGFAKRRAELIQVTQSGQETRQVLSSYKPVVLEQFLAITATASVLTYALYTVSPETVAMHGTDHLIYTVPLIVYAIFRYFFLLHQQGSGQDTARDLMRDPHLLLTSLAWVALTVSILR